MVTGLLARANRILRAGTDEETPVAVSHVLACMVIFGALYGAAMGMYSGLQPGRGMQVLYSAAKVPLLLAVTGAISLPGYFVIGTLWGVRSDLSQSIGALIESQAALTIVLASLAPVTLLWYASSAEYDTAVLFNGVIFALAAAASRIIVRRRFRALIRRDPRHRLLLATWFLLYAFVGVQMGWLLRPFIGSPGQPPSLFRQGAWDNAYVIIGEMVWRTSGVGSR